MSPREAILALNLLPSFGPVRISRLLEHFGDAESVLSASESKLQRVDGIGPETAKIISRWEDHADPSSEIAEAEKKDSVFGEVFFDGPVLLHHGS